MFYYMKVDVKILHICLYLFDPFRRLFSSDPTQHGFRGGHIFDDVMQLLSSGNNTVGMAYLDFAKAFDKVDHGVLLHKIKMFGITGKFGVCLSHFNR